MRVGFLVVVVFGLSVWFGAPQAYHAYHLHQGQALFYEDAAAAESHLERAASTRVRNPWSHIYLARIMMMRDEIDVAEDHIGLAFEKLPPHSNFDRMVLYNESGKLALRRAEYQAALDSFTQGLALIEHLRAQPDAMPELAEDAAISSLNISRALRQLGRLDEALEMAERSLRERSALLLSSISSTRAPAGYGNAVRMRAVAISDIADILVDMNRTDEALERYEEASEQFVRANAAGTPTNQANRDRAGIRWDVARLHLGLDNVDAARDAFLVTLDLMERVIEDDPNYPNIHWHHSQALFETAELFNGHLDLEDFDRFQSDYLSGTANQTVHNHYAIWAHLFAGDRLALQDDPDSALQAFERALDMANSRVAQFPEEPAFQREIWIAQLRSAQLGLPQSREHAEAALSRLEALHAEGKLIPEDEEYIDIARDLLDED